MNSNLEGCLSQPTTAVPQDDARPIRVQHNAPTMFRVAEYPDGRKILQGGYVWSQGSVGGIHWEDLPLVRVDETGQEIS